MPLQQAEIAGIILSSAVILFATLLTGLLLHLRRKGLLKPGTHDQFTQEKYTASPCLSVSSPSIPVPRSCLLPDRPFLHNYYAASTAGSASSYYDNSQGTPESVTDTSRSYTTLEADAYKHSFAGDGDSDSTSYKDSKEGWLSDLFTIPAQSRRPMSMYTAETASMYSIDSAPPELHDLYLPRRTKSRASLRSYITYNRPVLESEEGEKKVMGNRSGSSGYSVRFHAGLPLPPIPVASSAPLHISYPRSKRNIRPLPLAPTAKRLPRPSVLLPHLKEIDE
ncbi:hypothetical protein L218DRAFT_1077356 [Marasmius fiardii PR-910]|nr:hypothetical protein L218DRAFT_1077356 [Marasmius fiardii PR-910]